MDKKEPWLCSLMWEHLSIHPHGHASPCCAVDWESNISVAKNKVGGKFTPKALNVRDGVERLINSDSYKEMRVDMLNGDVPTPCNTCRKVEIDGGESKRQREEIRNKVDYSTITSPDGTIVPDIRNLELRLGNFCNLKCRSCNAESSTSWIDDYYKLRNKIPLPSNYDSLKNSEDTDYDWVEDIDFYVEILKSSPNMDMLQISGGEPFLVDKHKILLDLLIKEDIAKNVSISYITNANYNFDKLKPMFDRLTHFKHVNINISIDDIFERNKYIRSLSDFDLTIRNTKRFIEEYDFTFGVNQTISAFNFLHVEELTQYLVKEGIMAEDFEDNSKLNYINDNYVLTPDYQNPNILPLEVRRKKLDSIKGLIPNHYYKRLYDTFYNSEYNGKAPIFIEVTDNVDELRREKVRDTFPELIEALQPVLIPKI